MLTRGNPAYRAGVLGRKLDELEPYLVMATRTMMFEEAVMRFCGIDEIPSFDDPQTGSKKEEFFLGHACDGKQIPDCLKFYQGFFHDFTDQSLGEQVCIPKCRRKA